MVDLVIDFCFQFIPVHPKVTAAQKVYVGHEQTALLTCEVEGNPTPIISWSPCHEKYVVCDKRYLNISKVQTARANYTCTATNAQGVDSATTVLRKWTLLYTSSFVARKFFCSFMSFVALFKLNWLISATPLE